MQDSAEVMVDDPYQFETFSGEGGSLTGEIQAPVAGHYGFGVYRKAEYFSGICLRVCYDDSLIYSGCDAGSLVEDGPWYWLLGLGTGFTTPYFSKFDFSFSSWYLTYGQSTQVSFGGYDDSTRTAWSPTDPITLTIVSGSEYASFHKIDSQTGADVQVGSVLTTTVDDNEGYSLVADGIQPDSMAEWILIKGESGGLSNTDSIQILPWPVVVTIVPSTLSPGDTASIRVKQRNPDGTISDFPPGQLYEVGISSGRDYGTIFSSKGKDTLDYFKDITRGFKFIAADSIPGDSETVAIRVGVPPAVGPPSSVVAGGTGKMGQATYVARAGSLPGVTTGTVQSSGIKSKSSIKPEAPYAEKVSAARGGLKAISDDISFSYTDYGVGYAEVEKPELVVDYPTDNLLETKKITKVPSMPEITPRAHLESYTGGSVVYYWNLRVQWEGPDGRQFDNSFPGNTTAKNSNVSPWTIYWNNMIRGGDEITLDVTATAGGKVYDKTVNHGYVIGGLNPTPDQVKNGLSIEEQVIVYMESKPKWHHFIKDHDFPIFGGPHGYGLMQLDNPRATDEQVWNWMENRAEGRRRFAGKEALAAAHPAKVRSKGGAYRYATDFTQQEYLTEAFQLYNGYYYWAWHPGYVWAPMLGGYWQKDPNLGVKHGRDYGGPAIEVYNNVVSGNPPSGW